MINLMYVVLMAMLALNISTEVLNGFSIVEESLNRTTSNSSKENESIYSDFLEQMKTNPEKVKAWFDKATMVKQMSDSLYNYAQSLKEQIVKEADGDDADLNNIVGKDNLEAAAHVMLAPGTGQGKKLYDAINSYRERILKMVNDDHQRQLIAENLSTKIPKKGNALGKNWQEYMFESMPVAAAVTLLAKLQSDIRYAEGEVLHTLVANIDIKDIRVNKLDAFVIPEKTTLYPGETFSANIVMAAVDTTQQPEIYVNGVKVNTTNGKYSFSASGVGEHQFAGYMLMRNGAGDILRRDFLQKYEVIQPPSGATIAADLMNVLYAGYSNPMSISVPGIPQNAVHVSMTGGSLRSKGNGHYVAVPSAVGKDVVFSISATERGKLRQMGSFSFKVRKLPDPVAFINIPGANGTTERYKGGRALSKSAVLNAKSLDAAIDDDMLNIDFRVTGFDIVMLDSNGDAARERSSGANFSQQQKDRIRRMTKGIFYISNIKAIGPDGIERTLSPVEVRVGH